MDGAAALSPDLVLVLPPEERRRAIAELAAPGPPVYYAAPRAAAPRTTVESRFLAAPIVRYAIYKSVVAAAWYVAFAFAVGLLVAVLAVR